MPFPWNHQTRTMFFRHIWHKDLSRPSRFSRPSRYSRLSRLSPQRIRKKLPPRSTSWPNRLILSDSIWRNYADATDAMLAAVEAVSSMEWGGMMDLACFLEPAEPLAHEVVVSSSCHGSFTPCSSTIGVMKRYGFPSNATNFWQIIWNF